MVRSAFRDGVKPRPIVDDVGGTSRRTKPMTAIFALLVPRRSGERRKPHSRLWMVGRPA